MELRAKEYTDKYDRLSFPNRLKKQAEEKNYKKFIDMFRGLHINILLADVEIR